MEIRTVLVTGGGGYVGAVLVPKLLQMGYVVRVLDLFLFGENVLDGCKSNPRLSIIRGDIRDAQLLERVLAECDAVIHLACISNDPSFELDPCLGKAINYDAFPPLVKLAKRKGTRRFIYASSSSVYGIKAEKNVTEDLPLEPLTDYSRFKALCEEILLNEQTADFTPVIIRPATVCGYSPRMRLDLIVNILTNHAINNRKIKVFGGTQMRPNIHIEDISDLYVQLLRYPQEILRGRIYNAGDENYTVQQLAELVRDAIEPGIEIEVTPTDDPRSYHISSEKLKRELGFAPRSTIRQAVLDMKAAFEAARIPGAMTDPRYYNIRTMQQLKLR